MRKLVLLMLFPFITYGQVQLGQDITNEDTTGCFGSAVDISADGTIMIIADSCSNVIDSSAGLAKVYEWNSNEWEQIGEDILGEFIANTLGSEVEISANGNIVAVSLPGYVVSGSPGFPGQIRIYENISNSWIQIGQSITGIDNENLGIGGLSLSADGTTVAAGGPNDNSGRVVVYDYINGEWVQKGSSLFGDNEDGRFGQNLQLSADGNILAVADTSTSILSNVKIYTYNNDDWVQIGQTINADTPNTNFGSGLSLSPEGSFLAIASISSENQKVNVYEMINDTWTQIGEDINGPIEFGQFGREISISGNGSTLAIGSPFSDINGLNDGFVRVFEKQNNNWIQIGDDFNGLFPEAHAGSSITLSNNGTILSFGAVSSTTSNASGYVQVYDLSDLLSIEELTPSFFSLYPNPATTQITIEIPQENDLKKITIYNSLGQEVTTSIEATINTAELSKGIYIVEVLTSQGTSIKKLIIE